MPGVPHPRKSGAHRLACLSLYRALLKQCTEFTRHASPTAPIPSSTLQSLISYRFHKDRKLDSPSRIANGLSAGHSLLHLLHNATTGSAPALAKLTQLMTATAALAESKAETRALAAAKPRKPPPPSTHARIAHIRRAATKANHVRRPDNPPILERPLPLAQIKSGTRKVPYLVSARGIPFLRYPGHRQPEGLGRVIRQLDAWYVRKEAQRKELQVDMVLGRWEDGWDEILEREFGVQSEDDVERDAFSKTSRGKRRNSWAEVAETADTMLHHQMNEKNRKHGEMGKKMWEIVKKEKALAELEQKQAKEEKQKRKREAYERSREASKVGVEVS